MVSMESLAPTQDNVTALDFFFLMHIVLAMCLVIACLLVLMGLVKEIFHVNVKKHPPRP